MDVSAIFDPTAYQHSMRFFSAACFKIAIVNIIGGLLFGYQIGFVGVYNTYYSINANCSALESEVACHSVYHADCVWGAFDVVGVNASEAACYFSDIRDGLVCAVYSNSSGACGDHSGCVYNHDSDVCEHAAGWSATEVGIFAGAMIVGGMIGSFGVSPPLRLLGRKKVIVLVGFIGALASGMMHVGSYLDSYPLCVAARVLVGVAGGMACVVCPMYVDEMAPEEVKGPVGVLFQVFCTLGIALVAGIGFGVAPRDFYADLQMQMRMQVVIGVSTFCCALIIPVGLLVEESRKWKGESYTTDEASELRGSPTFEDSDSSRGMWSGNVGPLICAIVLSVAQQFTGINAIMNYAPSITNSIGLSPLLGNFVVMAWNFVTTLISIPVARRFSMRQMYLAGTLVASGACLMTGVPVLPGVVSNDDTRHLLAGIGIIIFIAAFEIGMGPAFYVLAQEMFPKQFRSKGSSFTIVVQFIFNIIINVCFPIAVSGLSGGPSGNQNKGMSIVFMFFGSCGLCSWLVLMKTLKTSGSSLNEGQINQK